MFETVSPRLQYGAIVAALAVLGTSLTYTFIGWGSVTNAGVVIAWWLFAFTFVSWFAMRNLTGDDAVEGGEEA